MHVRLTEKMECSKKERIRIKLLSLVVAVALISLLIGILQYPVFSQAPHAVQYSIFILYMSKTL